MKDRNFRLRWIPIGEDAGCDGTLKVLQTPFPIRDLGGVDDLTESILRHGILSPLLVREVSGALQVVCGYRRYRAAIAAGLTTMPVLLSELTDAEALRCYLSEQIVRERVDDDESPLMPAIESNEDAQTEAAASERRVATKQQCQHSIDNRLDVINSKTPQSATVRPADVREVATRILRRTEALFSEAHVQRRLSPDQVEGIVDSLLGLLGENEDLDLRFLVPHQGDNDPTPAHSLVVAAMCYQAAAPFDYNEHQRRGLIAGGLLHDIGMTFIRSTALRSPQTFRRSGERLLHSHPRIGCAIIQATGAWTPQVAWCARDHHERYDGSGYPSGKKGRDVCTMSRLVGIIDSYCALTSPRAHRRALSSAAAWDRLERATARGLFDSVIFHHLAAHCCAHSEDAASPTSPKAQKRFRRNTVAKTKATDKIHADS